MNNFYYKIAIISFLLLSNFVYSQTYNKENGGFVAANTSTGASQGISTFNNSEREVTGSSYLIKEWSVGSIITYNNEGDSNIPIRYDLEGNVVEYKKGIQTYWLKGDRVKKIQWLNPKTAETETFINAKEYKGLVKGFVKVIYDGNYSLIENYSLDKKENATVSALDIGTNGEKIIVKSDLYFLEGDQYQLVPTSKKKFVEILPEDIQTQTLAFIKSEKISLRDNKDLVKLFQWLNSLEN